VGRSPNFHMDRPVVLAVDPVGDVYVVDVFGPDVLVPDVMIQDIPM
jgi:hypothetical protein